MATLDEVLALAIDDYDPEEFYDGQDQIVKESLTEFFENDSFDGEDAESVLEKYEEAYAGWFATLGDFAYELAESIGEIDTSDLSWPLYCIDWDKAGRELIIGGDYWESGGYYFHNY